MRRPLAAGIAIALTVSGCGPDGEQAALAELRADQASTDGGAGRADDDSVPGPDGDRRSTGEETTTPDLHPATTTTTPAPTGAGGTTTTTTMTTTTAPITTPAATTTTTTTPATTAVTTTTTAPTTTTPTTTAPTTTTTTTTTTTIAPDELDTAAAGAALDALVAELRFSDELAYLLTCPPDPTGAIFDAVFESVIGGPLGPAFDATTSAVAIELDPPYPPLVTCDRFDGSFDNGIGLSASRSPADIHAYARAFANPDGDPGITVTVTESSTVSGGTTYRVCSENTIDPALTYCEIAWVGDGLMLTAWATGEEAGSIPLAPIETALADHLPELVANLSGAPSA